jgi:hypothetical protein
MMDKTKELLADTMGQAAGLLGVDVRILQAAKRAGCSAFRAGAHVHLGELRSWLESHPEIANKPNAEQVMQGAEVRSKIAQAKTREHHLARLEREVIPASEVKRSVTQAFVVLKAKCFTIPSAKATKWSVLQDPVAIEQDCYDALREAFESVSKSEWLAKCPHCGKEIQ